MKKLFDEKERLEMLNKIRFYIVNPDLEDESNDTIAKVQPLDKQE